VVEDPVGVFHPKVLIGVKGKVARALVGSSNFTTGGFAGNTEVNVLLSGPLEDPSLMELASFIEEQWGHPRAFEPDDHWFDHYERRYERELKPPTLSTRRTRPRHIVEGASDLELDWTGFVDLISQQERRMLSRDWRIHVFEHPDGSYLQEVEVCQAAFAAEPSYAKMSVQDRMLVAGWGPRSTGYFGRMTGAGHFKNMTKERPSEVGKHLDRIPMGRAITIAQARECLNGMISINGVGLGAATRLLTMKRPDVFLPANNASLVEIRRVFGTSPSTVDKYVALLQRVWGLPWFLAPIPKSTTSARMWRARVALLDAIFYEPL
jgi:hypothetical protein